MGASVGAMAMGGPHLYCAWRTGKAVGKLKPAVAQGRRQGRVMRDAGGGGARMGNEEGASGATNAGYMETGLEGSRARENSRGSHARSRKVFSHLLLWPTCCRWILFIYCINSSRRSSRWSDGKKKSGDMARGIVNNFFRLSLYIHARLILGRIYCAAHLGVTAVAQIPPFVRCFTWRSSAQGKNHRAPYVFILYWVVICAYCCVLVWNNIVQHCVWPPIFKKKSTI
jgi:hypothetical protein